MKYLETNHERNSATITTLIVAILTLLCFVVGQDYKVEPEEYGVAINFGNTAAGGETIEPIAPQEPQETASEETVEEELVEEELVEEEVAEEETVEEEVVEEAVKEIEAAEKQAIEEEKILKEEAEIAEKLKKEEEAKEKAEAEAKEKAAKEAKEKAEKEAKEAEAKAKGKAAAKARAAERAKAAAEAKAKADGKAKADAAAAAKKKQGSGAVKFSLIESVPIYPGCEGGDNNAKKKCMNTKIAQFLSDNFDTSVASDLAGKQKIFIAFNIDKSGNVVSIRAKAADPRLTAEAKRVSDLLPKMKPGMQQGKPVVVKFGLPIAINMK